MKKISLLGGSNSILSNSLRDGLTSETNYLTNYSLGASTSLQCLYSILDNHEEISKSDLIITESNVNDSHIINNLEIDEDLVLINIDSYYQALNSLALKTVIILMPFNEKKNKTESVETFKKITEQHLINAALYEMPVINLNDITKNINKDLLDLFLPDPRHPNIAFMYTLGKNIIKNFNLIPEVNNKNTSNLPPFRIVHAQNISDELVIKKNSLFEKTTSRLNKKYFFDSSLDGEYIVAICTWCDTNTAIKIKSNTRIIIKPFNKLLAFNELETPLEIKNATSIEPLTEKENITEASINTRNYKTLTPPLIHGVLISKENPLKKTILTNTKKNKNLIELSTVIPDIKPFLKSIEFFLNKSEIKDLIKHKIIKNKESESISKILKALAIESERLQIKEAIDIMKIAHKINGNDPFIKKWIYNKERKYEMD